MEIDFSYAVVVDGGEFGVSVGDSLDEDHGSEITATYLGL